MKHPNTYLRKNGYVTELKDKKIKLSSETKSINKK